MEQLPVKVGDKIYKICPVCNSRHRESKSCKDCAWGSCIRNGACEVGLRIYSDGSGKNGEFIIVELVVYGTHIYDIYNNLNTMYFMNKDDAEVAIGEYSEIAKIESKSNRYEAYKEWYMKRKIINPLAREVKVDEEV